MPLHCLPRASGGYAHFLVVVSGRTTGREGVVQPESVIRGQAVRDVGECCRPFVCCDDKIGIIGVVTHHLPRSYDLSVDNIIGEIEQTGDEDLVACDGLGHYCLTITIRQTLRYEATLGSGGNNHGVLDNLRFHEPQDFGSKIGPAVGPSNTPPCDIATTQMHTLYAR